MKVLVGMSGGVDSSVTALLLKEQGHEVEGISFILYEARMKETFAGCCSIEAINDARRTAEQIGVRHTRLDLRGVFLEKVIQPFIDAYSRGQTPNPCILCNRHIKFPYLFNSARDMQADCIATGHYARSDAGVLKKGIDPKKDQSYVLYVLRPEELSSLMLPLGSMRKEDVRKIAGQLDLPAARRPESQEICFVGEKNYCRFLESVAREGEGPLIDITSGKVLARHQGVHLFTIGQRKRMGVATGSPLYVVRIDPSINAVYVGPRTLAMRSEFTVKEINWLLPPLPTKGEKGFRASVKVRSMMRDEPATLTMLSDEKVRVVYDEPQWAPAPGQSAVFYDGDVVTGGGIIDDGLLPG